MNPLVLEVITFGGFASVGIGAYVLKALIQKRKIAGIAPSFIARHLGKGLVLVAVALGHPITVTAAKEYAVHFIVYSGYLIKAGH